MDAGFYRGTSSEQDSRFTDKERKLLKQMKFEDVLNTKVDLSRVNLEVIKPWIAAKINDILGMEDDVVIEYIFTQLEEKNPNPKIMQINLTGFLNAKRSREFMAELWAMFIEAQGTPDGIPTSIVEKKVEELKATGGVKEERGSLAKATETETDWKHRYQSLTGGRYGKAMSGDKEDNFSRPSVPRRDEGRVAPGNSRDGEQRRDRPVEHYRDRRRDWDRERDRGDRYRDRDDYRRRRSRTRSPPSPPHRRFKEEPVGDGEERPSKRRNDGGTPHSNGEERKKKKRKKHKHHNHSDASDAEAAPKKAKKHKKEKKKKHHHGDHD